MCHPPANICDLETRGIKQIVSMMAHSMPNNLLLHTCMRGVLINVV